MRHRTHAAFIPNAGREAIGRCVTNVSLLLPRCRAQFSRVWRARTPLPKKAGRSRRGSDEKRRGEGTKSTAQGRPWHYYYY